jgi:hypothetical protein
MTAGALLENVRRRGATATVTTAGKLRVEPGALLDAALLADLKAHRDELIAELRHRDPAALIEEARSACLELSVEGDGLRVRHRTEPVPDAALVQRIADNKPAVIEELRQQADLLAYAIVKLHLVDDRDHRSTVSKRARP